MYCTYMLTIASLKMFVRNRQALFFSLFMPLMILLIFGSMNFDKPSQMHIGLVTHHPTAATAQFLQGIRAVEALGIHEGSRDDELAELRGGNRTAVLDVPDDLLAPGNAGDPRELTVYVNTGRPMETQMAMSCLNQMADHVSLAVAHAPPVFTIKQEAVNAHNSRYIEFLLPGVIAMSVMQMSVFSVTFVFARYREQGILKRLTATPMRPSQFVTANIITRLFTSVLQASIFVVLGFLIFRIHVAGAYWLLAVCVILGALMFLGLGFTISGFARSIETVPVLANVVVFPMLFLGNVFFPISGMPSWLRAVAGYLPLTYFASAMRGVMTDGAGLFVIRRDLTGMFVWAVVLITLATVTFRFQEKEGA